MCLRAGKGEREQGGTASGLEDAQKPVHHGGREASEVVSRLWSRTTCTPTRSHPAHRDTPGWQQGPSWAGLGCRRQLVFSQTGLPSSHGTEQQKRVRRAAGSPADGGCLEVQPSVGREAAEQLGLVRATRLRCRASPPSSAPAEGRTARKMPQPSGLLRVSWANTPFTSLLSEVNICLSLLSALCCDATN